MTPDAIDRTIDRAIDRALAATNSKDLDAGDDFDTCKERSRALTRTLRAAGVDARWVQVAGMVTDAPDCDPRWRTVPPDSWIHYVTVVDGTVIDTAPRQFWPDAQTPLRCDHYLSRWAQHHDITSAL